MSLFLGIRKNLIHTKKSVDLSGLVKTNGTTPMAGNLNLANYAIDNLKTYPENNKQATSRKYVDDETSKLLDLDATRQMKGDLDMGDNAIVGIDDINASNSVPSKKYVDDELAKRDTKLTQTQTILQRNSQENIQQTSDIQTLTSNLSALTTAVQAREKYSHYSSFLYTNPVSGVYKDPLVYPSGQAAKTFYLSSDYGEKTKLTLLGLECDSDRALTTSGALPFSVEGIFYKDSGYDTKVIVSGWNIRSKRIDGNKFRLNRTLSFKDFHTRNNYLDWRSFKLKIAVPWTNNETCLHFCVTYY